MQFITGSVGVEVEFCHVRHGFDKDDKQSKQTARRMIQMMFAINTSQFQGERAVTCYTCHRGSAKPVSIPMEYSKAPYVSEARLAADPAAPGRTDLPPPPRATENHLQP